MKFNPFSANTQDKKCDLCILLLQIKYKGFIIHKNLIDKLVKRAKICRHFPLSSVT